MTLDDIASVCAALDEAEVPTEQRIMYVTRANLELGLVAGFIRETPTGEYELVVLGE